MVWYANLVPGHFLSRPNRFIAHVEIKGQEEIVHVKNTGRCRELLVPGATVWCQHWDNPTRKTAWDLIAVQKGDRLINMDSQVPNKLAYDYVLAGGLGFAPDLLKPEQTYGQSRFDLYYEAGEKRGFIEVKGVTLEEEGIVRFPDAPTQRGRKHLLELADAAAHGYEAWVLFVIQMDRVEHFEPNWPRDPNFARALVAADQRHVRIRAVECTVQPDRLECTDQVPIVLNP